MRGRVEMGEGRFIASIADIKYLREMPEEYLPYVKHRAELERRRLSGDEMVALLNVSTTTSYIAVFLDRGKRIEDVEREVAEAGASLNSDSRKALERLLEAGRI